MFKEGARRTTFGGLWYHFLCKWKCRTYPEHIFIVSHSSDFVDKSRVVCKDVEDLCVRGGGDFGVVVSHVYLYHARCGVCPHQLRAICK